MDGWMDRCKRLAHIHLSICKGPFHIPFRCRLQSAEAPHTSINKFCFSVFFGENAFPKLPRQIFRVPFMFHLVEGISFFYLYVCLSFMFHLGLGGYPVWPESNPNQVWFLKLEPEMKPNLVSELEPEPQFLKKQLREKWFGRGG